MSPGLMRADTREAVAAAVRWRYTVGGLVRGMCHTACAPTIQSHGPGAGAVCVATMAAARATHTTSLRRFDHTLRYMVALSSRDSRPVNSASGTSTVDINGRWSDASRAPGTSMISQDFKNVVCFAGTKK